MNPDVAEDQALTAHLRALRLEVGLAKRTIESYARDLTQFAAFLAQRESALTDATAEDVRGYLSLGKWRPSTRARKAAAIRSFYRRRVSLGLTASDPTRSLPSPRLESTLPRTLTVDQVGRLLTKPKATPGGLRDRALLETLYGAGLRASEALGLRLQDVDLEVGFVRTIGKGDKERIVPLGRMAMEGLSWEGRGRSRRRNCF
jgi:integrase/recombinase XerD